MVSANNHLSSKLKEKRVLNKNSTIQRTLSDLKQQIGKLAQIIQVVSIPTFVIDKGHKVIVWNKALENLTGKSATDILDTCNQWVAFYGRKRPVLADLIVDSADEQEIEKHYSQKYRKSLIEGGYEAEDFFPDLGDNGRWLFFTASPLIDRSGNCIGAIETLQDVTSRKTAEQRLRESEHRYRVLTENVVDGVVLVQQQKLIFSNRAFRQMFGFGESEDITPINIIKLAAPQYRKEFRNAINRLESGVSDQRIFQVACQNLAGNEFWVEMHVNLIKWKGKPAVLSTLQDITENRKKTLAMKAEAETLRQEVLHLRANAKDRYRFGDIIGKCAGMQHVYDMIQQAAKTDASVIIYGESGTGKELVANAIHNLSQHNKFRFVPVNCGAIPENLIESEFFGYKKGAFTGAQHDKLGYLDLADQGTLFLDEVGEIPLNMQIKLLRAIEESGFTPLGGSRVHKPKIRIIAATNKNLVELVKKKSMREDFFFRINIIPINLPPLRERKEDLSLLIDHFLKKYETSEPIMPLAGKIIEMFYHYAWPGNVRELQNLIYRYVSLNESDFLRELPEILKISSEAEEDKTPADPPPDLPSAIEMLEAKMIRETLYKTRWHRVKAAQLLKIDRKTLYAKIRKYGLMSLDSYDGE